MDVGLPARVERLGTVYLLFMIPLVFTVTRYFGYRSFRAPLSPLRLRATFSLLIIGKPLQRDINTKSTGKRLVPTDITDIAPTCDYLRSSAKLHYVRYYGLT